MSIYIKLTQPNWVLLLLTVFVVSMTACSSSKNATRTNNSVSESRLSSLDEVNEAEDLTESLSRISGVRVNGYGPYASIIVRANDVSSFSGNTRPLFVIDGNIVGTNYSQVYALVESHYIRNIRVLKGAETARYGNQGGGGVILINTQWEK